uniref:Uncharacterized protein n=1 Tax=Amphimedon queenslandica TaxID=400682 RepID=A0A1X7T3A6_AMPQE
MYSVISLKSMIVAEIVQDLYHYTPNEKETVCIAVDMCSGEDPPVYITLPPSSQEFIKSISQIQMLVNDGWEMSFEESMLSRRNIRINDTEIPSGYWNGVNFVDSVSLLPQFDVRLKLIALRKFMNSNVLWTFLNITGFVYYQPQTSPNEAEGMINGSIYLSLNMSFNGVPGKMILTTESSPALFSVMSMQDNNNIMMKLDYSTGDTDQFFSKIFHCITRACPVDVFIQLTQRRNISFILIHSSEIALSIGSYTFPREVLKHTISIDSQSSENPLLSEAPLHITSNLSAGSQLVLNSFVSLRQPAVGSAISVVYQNNGSFTAKLAEISFSMLNTVITTPVEISSDSGLTFSTFNADVLSMYKVQVTGKSQPENNWRNFTLNINGIFKTRPPGSFTSDLEAYTHEYIENKVQEARARLNNALSAVAHTESVILLYNTTLEKEKANLITLNDMYLHAVNRVSQSASALNQAQYLYSNANASVLA